MKQVELDIYETFTKNKKAIVGFEFSDHGGPPLSQAKECRFRVISLEPTSEDDTKLGWQKIRVQRIDKGKQVYPECETGPETK
jgi:hypothetical protein